MRVRRHASYKDLEIGLKVENSNHVYKGLGIEEMFNKYDNLVLCLICMESRRFS